ncbi:glutathione binding-like protein [Pendulispora albinea]|uniref:Glutathione binding-like protein n=1 Tax=Pendulispora albinea TaxID=2741071 RepID=A0ABZ2M6P3_9BACT
MKLYYARGTCSLASHIVAQEADIPLELERVDIAKTPHRTSDGKDFGAIHANAYVPALRLDDGSLLTEGVAIVQYLADRRPESRLAPPAGTLERYRLQAWLTFISSELHKMYSPWLFHPEFGEQAAEVARAKIATRLAFVEDHFAGKGHLVPSGAAELSGPYLLGETFTAADAYLYTIVGWSPFTKIDLQPFPRIRAFMTQVSSRPKVREALRGHGMKVPAEGEWR